MRRRRGSEQRQPHQSPAIGDCQGRQIGIAPEPGRQFSATQQVVKHFPAVVLRLSPARSVAALSPCSTLLRKSCLRVTRSLAARAFSRANSGPGNSRVVRMRTAWLRPEW
jgi:hypothetical protein